MFPNDFCLCAGKYQTQSIDFCSLIFSHLQTLIDFLFFSFLSNFTEHLMSYKAMVVSRASESLAPWQLAKHQCNYVVGEHSKHVLSNAVMKMQLKPCSRLIFKKLFRSRKERAIDFSRFLDTICISKSVQYQNQQNPFKSQIAKMVGNVGL